MRLVSVSDFRTRTRALFPRCVLVGRLVRKQVLRRWINARERDCVCVVQARDWRVIRMSRTGPLLGSGPDKPGRCSERGGGVSRPPASVEGDTEPLRPSLASATRGLAARTRRRSRSRKREVPPKLSARARLQARESAGPLLRIAGQFPKCIALSPGFGGVSHRPPHVEQTSDETEPDS